MKKLIYFRVKLLSFAVAIYCAPTQAQNSNALDFDGSSDRVQISNAPLFNPSHISLQAWVKMNTTTGWRYRAVVTKRNCCGDSLEQWTMQTDSNGLMHFHAITDSVMAFITDTSLMQVGIWTHFTATYDGHVACLYRNGNLVVYDSLAEGNILPKSFPVVIGDRDGGLDWFPGAIDEVRIWDYALTQQEIRDNMNCHLAGNEPGLIAYYDFNQGIPGGNNAGIVTLPDLTGHGFNGTLQSFSLNGATSNWIGSFFADSSVFVATQPLDAIHLVGDTAVFITATPTAGAAFQWQTDSSGSGYHDISDGNQYSGTSDDTLVVSNVTLANNSQSFRCIISSAGYCEALTDNASLYVNDNSGVYESISEQKVFIYPNPSNGVFTVDFRESSNLGRTIAIKNSIYQEVFRSNSNLQFFKLRLNETLVPGIYFLEILGAYEKVQSVKKIIIQ